MPSLRRALLAAPLLMPCAALAQTTMPPTTVTADRERLTAESNEAARIRLWSSPGANTLVPASEFQNRPGATTVRDIFEFTPGIFAQPKWGEDARFSIRGSGLARNFHLRGVLVMQDGIPFNQADGSGDLQEIDPLAYQRVEVFRGGNAFAFNNATLGGAVNFISNSGASAQGGTARVEAGTEAYLRSQLAYGIARGGWDAYASSTFSRADGYRRNSAQLNTRLNANAAYRWGDGVETRIIASYNNIWQQIPGAVTLRGALDNPRAPNATNLALRYQRNIESFRLGTITTWQATPELRLEAGGSFVDRQLDHPIFQFVDQATRDVHLFARGVWDGQVAGMRNRLAFGANFAQGTIDNLRFVNAAGLRGARTFSSLDYARNITAFAENALYVLPNLALVAGIQGGQAQRESRNRLNAALSGAGEWAWANPRFGLLWQVTPEVQAYANATWSTEPPTLSDLTPLVPLGGFSRLAAQRAYTLEFGTRGQHGAFNWEVAAYRSWLRNEIQLFAGATPGSSFALNAARTDRIGVEAAIGARLAENALAAGDRLSARAAYSYNDFRFVRDAVYGNNELPGVPRHSLRAELRYEHPSGVWVAPNFETMPRGFFVDNANTLRGSPYNLVGLRAGANLLEGRLSVFLDARNLGDARYVSSASVTPRATGTPALFEPGFGRAVFAGAQWRF